MQTYLDPKKCRAVVNYIAEGQDWRIEQEDEPR